MIAQHIFFKKCAPQEQPPHTVQVKWKIPLIDSMFLDYSILYDYDAMNKWYTIAQLGD